MLDRIDRLTTLITRCAAAVGAMAIVAICVLIMIELVLRNLFGRTTGLSVEFSTYLFVLLVFAALARAQNTGTMIYLAVGYDRYPPRLRQLLDALRGSLGVAFGLVATYHIYLFTERTCALGQVSMFPSRTPLCGPQAIMVGGFALLTLEYLRGAIMAWRAVAARAPQMQSERMEH